MPPRAATVRFSEDLWADLEAEAARQGTAVAQVVRDATLLRLGALRAARADGQRSDLTVPPRDATPAPPAAGDPPAPNERRIETLRRAGLLDGESEPSFDRLARIAAQVLNTPVALVSMVSADEHTFKSCVGLPLEWSERGSLPVTHSFCVHTVALARPLIVGDVREHPLLAGNPAIDELDALAYAGIPLITSDGLVIGTLCVLDRQPRVWTGDQVGLLTDLAAVIVDEIEARSRRPLAGPSS